MTDTQRGPGEHPEFGYGDVDSRPDVDGADAGESGGGARPAVVPDRDGSGAEGGQTDPAYRGPANPNAPRNAA